MEQLIFVGIILLFSMLEAVARKKRDETPVPPPEEAEPRPQARVPQPRAPQAPGPRTPSYDEDPSFDDAVGAGSRPKAPTSSEGLIPADVWDEIQRMARGEAPGTRTQPPARPAPPPAPRPTPRSTPRPTPAPPTGAGRTARRAPQPPPQSAPEPRRAATAQPTPTPLVVKRATVPAAAAAEESREDHPVHGAHARYGTPVQDRLTGFAGEGKGARPAGAEGAALRRTLRAGGAGLRQAILLQEVLGPPVALRDDPER